jgi:serine-type D-Ala-D-Ala carboxypeptidase/endopeptidase (penicillin-binding protein 4)
VAAKLSAASRLALANPALGRSVPGLVVDAATGAVLLNRSATTKVPPASTTKIATASAVLAVISGQKRLDTRVVAGATPGQVVLVGGGDPTLSAAAPGQATLYPNAARLSSLAAAAQKALGRPVTSIVVDTSRFSGPALAPGWDPNDVPTSYGAAIQALMVDGGRPATGGDLRSARPALEAGRALARLLGRPTLPVTTGRAAPGARVLGTVHSAPVLDLIEQALLYSDNVIAEMLGRQVAVAEHQPLSFAGTVVAVRAALASVGFRLPATLADASGLSRRDRLSPAVLVALLRLDAGSAHPRLNQVVSALPVAGWEGSLSERYRTSSVAAAGRVRAKTGTLTGVVALAGLVRDRSGRLLIFAFVANQVPNGGTVSAEAALDRVVASFAACGCR